MKFEDFLLTILASLAFIMLIKGFIDIFL